MHHAWLIPIGVIFMLALVLLQTYIQDRMQQRRDADLRYRLRQAEETIRELRRPS